MENKCLEPKRKNCYLCRNESYSEGIGQFKEIKINDEEVIKIEVMKYNIKYTGEECPQRNVCLINNQEYRDGISFITKRSNESK